MGPACGPGRRPHRRGRPGARADRARHLRGQARRARGGRLSARAGRNALARSVLAGPAGGGPRAVAAGRPLGIRVAGRDLGGDRRGGDGDLRAPRRHVHGRGDLRRGGGPTRGPRADRRHGGRAPAGRDLPRHTELGLRRAVHVVAGRRVRRAGRPAAARRRRPRPWARRPPRRRVQPRRPRQRGADGVRAVLLDAIRDPVGRRDELRRPPMRRGPGVGDPERLHVGRRVPRGRASARRGARHRRRRAPASGRGAHGAGPRERGATPAGAPRRVGRERPGAGAAGARGRTRLRRRLGG